MLLNAIYAIALLLVMILVLQLTFWRNKKPAPSVAAQLLKMEPTLATDAKLNSSVNTVCSDGNNIITLTILATQKRLYSGYELLQSLLSLGFRYGELNIFHRHQNDDGTGAVLFSLAQAVHPGSFDLSDVGAIACPGLTLFMDTKLGHGAHMVLDMMIETAKQIAEELGGELYDDERKKLVPSSITRWHSQIQSDTADASRCM